jgi:hypothetical protein
MRLQVVFDQAIKAVCPIHGISFGKLEDKKTWEIHFIDEATEEQKLAANKVMNEFIFDESAENKKEKMNNYKNDLMIKLHYAQWLKNNPKGTFEEFIIYAESIEL